ncbi:ribonuclease Y [Patescibacteria group bacterium]|nr:ribonuclease Y [Patescibacteria group bacterium]
MNSIWIIGPLGLVVGLGVGYYVRQVFAAKSIKNLEERSKKIIDRAKEEEKEILISAKDKAFQMREEAEALNKERQKKIDDLELSLRKREESVDVRAERLERDRIQLETEEEQIGKTREELRGLRDKQLGSLERISALSKEEAKKVLLGMVEKEEKDEVLRIIKATEKEAKESADEEARKIIATVIGRIASDTASESTVSTVSLPSDEMKGRIIGREGRNIQAFERLAGVDVIIDDTPGAVVISSFDSVRRQVAKVALEKLVTDGRIHPTRIEEALKKATEEVDNEIKKAGDEAAYQIGIAGINHDLLKTLGRLKYRTSYGQNVLQHSIEVAEISGLLALELGYDAAVAKRAGLFHDIGKAVDHEVTGSHAIISQDILKKYGVDEKIIHAAAAHHEDIEMKDTLDFIVHAADAISGARPGARRETLETYVKRLEELEKVANSFSGVEKSYAIQAGREVRILVRPEDINDLEAVKLSRNIAKKIEKEMEYPGQIKVNVIRETRAVEYAK